MFPNIFFVESFLTEKRMLNLLTLLHFNGTASLSRMRPATVVRSLLRTLKDLVWIGSEIGRLVLKNHP
jgi:hypothetical protein